MAFKPTTFKPTTFKPMAFKRRAEPTTIDEERDALRAQYAALEDLKRELTERVRAVQQRELELSHALAEAGGVRPGAPSLPPPGGIDPAGGAQLVQREHELLEREQAIDAREHELGLRLEALHVEQAALPPPDPDAAQLAQIEARLAELSDAEKLFLRTRAEVAARSEAVAARERLVSQRERELDDREDGKGDWAGSGLSEVEARLRRLEEQRPGERTEGFAGGLRKLEQGTRSHRGG